MKLGLISDIHADAQALERALDLLAEFGADKVLCAGDLVEKGPDGDEVVAQLKQHLIPSVQGNHDQNALRHHNTAKTAHSDLLPDTLEHLASLPRTRFDVWEGIGILTIHGTGPKGSTPPIFGLKRFKRVLRQSDADVLVLGHSHIPALSYYRDILVINPGSVAHRKTRDSFTCALLQLPELDVQFLDLATGDPFTLELSAW